MKTKSYTEDKTEQKPFDWWKFIYHGKLCLHNRMDWIRAYSLANNWVTCPCGVQSKDIPRDHESGRPLDDTLELYGVRFEKACGDKDLNKMETNLRKIELRASELIKMKGIK